jgi:hypothetical protein
MVSLEMYWPQVLSLKYPGSITGAMVSLEMYWPQVLSLKYPGSIIGAMSEADRATGSVLKGSRKCLLHKYCL